MREREVIRILSGGGVEDCGQSLGEHHKKRNTRKIDTPVSRDKLPLLDHFHFRFVAHVQYLKVDWKEIK